VARSITEMNAVRIRFVKSSEAARRLGVTTKTLAKWRHERKGPAGWIYASATMTLYPENELETFIRERTGKTPVFNFRRPAPSE
jgi:DNA-binding transcriptional regulator YiaG